MKLTITGVNGFVGQNLSKFLENKGFEVSGLSLRNQWSFPNETDAIIHLAGKAHDTSNTAEESEYFKVNRDLTIQLFGQFLKSNTRDFFFFSSVKATADSVNGILDENHQSNPKTAYGRSKNEAEQYLLNQELPSGKRLFIIRPCMIHGPANKGNLNLLYKVVEKGIPWPLAAFHNERSFLGIDNLNFLIAEMLLNQNISSGIYNFADDDSVSTNDVIGLINEVLGLKSKMLFIPPIYLKKIAWLGDRLKLPLNTERLKKLTETYKVSNQKIKIELGVEKLPFTALEELKKTLLSFKN